MKQMYAYKLHAIDTQKLDRWHWLIQTNDCNARSPDGAVQTCANDHAALHRLKRRTSFIDNE